MNTKSYFCHNSIYDGSYPIPLLSRSCCLKYIGLKTKSNFALEIRYLQHFTMVSKRAILCMVCYVGIYLYQWRENWWYSLENYSFSHLSAKACKRKEWESRAISRWMCGFGPPFFHFFFFPPPLVRRPYTTADISESYQTTKPLRFRDAILIIYKHEN